MSRRLAAVMVVLLVCGAVVAQAQTVTNETIARLAEITRPDSGEWRFQHPAQPGGQDPALDDSKWTRVRPEHLWNFPNTEAWYRRLIVVPQTLGGVSPVGSKIVLRCAVDDDVEVYVNGQSRGKFHWDQCEATITDNARPGDKYLVALRVINGPVHGRLISASFTWDKYDAVREAAAAHLTRLQFAQKLLATERAAPDLESLTQTLDRAASQVRFSAIDTGGPEAFNASIQESLQTLAPFVKLAKQYTLYLVGHAHIDMNWLWLWPETKDVCRRTWDQALKFMDEFPGFTLTQSQPGAYLAMEEEQPQLFAQIQQAVRRGQWEPAGASWTEGDTNMASGEALARQVLLTQHYFETKFGRRTEMAWLPDNFGHAWTVPSIFSDAGIRNYYFSRCGKGLPTFWWEGPDGARLLAYNRGGYNGQFRAEAGSAPLDVEKQIGVPAAMHVYGVGDHGGGPTRQDLEAARRLQQEPLFPQVKFAQTSDYFNFARATAGDKLPVVKDELNFVFRGCYTTHADAKRWNRESENLLPAAEAACAIGRYWGADYPAADLTKAWQNTCFNQFHDIFDGSAIHGSYDYSRQLYEEATGTAERARSQALDRLWSQVDTSGEGQAVGLYNPLGWDRREYVEATFPASTELASAIVTDPAGKQIPSQVVGSATRADQVQVTVGFVADLPALGYAVYHLRPGTPRPAAERGRSYWIATLWEPRTPERELAEFAEVGLRDGLNQLAGKVAPEDPLGHLQILHEAPDGMSAWNVGQITGTDDLRTPEHCTTLTTSGVQRSLRYTQKYGKSTFTQTITAYKDLPRIDFELVADWQEVGNATDGGPLLKYMLPTSITNPQATFSLPWGSIERPANGQEVPGQQWIDLAQVHRVLPTDGREAKALNLSAYFNADVIATAAQPEDGDFDGGHRAYPAEIFADLAGSLMTLDGLPFYVPPTTSGAKNALLTEGQTLKWPAEKTPALAVLGAAANGAKKGTAQLLYADGSRQNVPLGFSDWCFGPGPQEVDALSAPFRYVDGQRSEPEVHLWLIRLPVDNSRALAGIVLPDQPDLYVFGMALADKVAYETEWGVSLLNDCKYGFDTNKNVMRMSLLRASYSPDPLPDQGTHRLRWSLYPHQGDWRQAATPRRAMEFNNPPLVRLLPSHEGPLPADYSFVKVEPESMVLSSFKLAEDGKGYIARVYNSCGAGGKATIRCNLPFSGAVACNLLEEPRGKNLVTVNYPVVTLDLDGRIHGTVRLLTP
ncbi:MAG: glycoside hydrolase family 38 C-terminal domain-containing protein [Armatimonadia bacterium]